MLIQKLLALILPLLLLGSKALAQSDDASVVAAAEEGRRQLAPLPLWWEQISASYEGSTPLKRCYRKSTAPENNSSCGRKAKTCFFGNQECDVPLPETKCTCQGRVWTCEDFTCPAEADVITTVPPGCPTLEAYQGGETACGTAGEECSYEWRDAREAENCDVTHNWVCDGATGKLGTPGLTEQCVPNYSPAFGCPSYESFQSGARGCGPVGAECKFEYRDARETVNCDVTETWMCGERYQLAAAPAGITEECVPNYSPVVGCPSYESFQSGARGCGPVGAECKFEYRDARETVNCDVTETWMCGERYQLAAAPAGITEECVPNYSPVVGCPSYESFQSGERGCGPVGAECKFEYRDARETVNCDVTETWMCGERYQLAAAPAGITEECVPNTAPSFP